MTLSNHDAEPTPGAGDAQRLTAEILESVVAISSSIRCAGSGRLLKLGVSMTHMHILWMLQHHGSLPMSRIAEQMGVSFSNATGIVDRMEERQLVERVRVPDDRRVVLVRIADGGRQALEGIEALRQDRLTAILAKLAPERLAGLAAAIHDIRRIVEAEGGPAPGEHAHPDPTPPPAHAHA